MSELPALPEIESAEQIPAVLAAPKPKKVKPPKIAVEPFVPTKATFPDAVPTATAAEVEPVQAGAAPLNPTAAATAEPTLEEPTMATTFETVTDAATAPSQFADLNARATDAMAKGSKMFADLNGFTKGNVEALVESGKLAFAGFQTLAQGQAAFVRKQFEDATAQARTVATVKSPTEFAKLQGDYVRQQFDAMVAETSRSTEAMLKLAGEVVQPISNRVAVAVEQFKKAA